MLDSTLLRRLVLFTLEAGIFKKNNFFFAHRSRTKLLRLFVLKPGGNPDALDI